MATDLKGELQSVFEARPPSSQTAADGIGQAIMDYVASTGTGGGVTPAANVVAETTPGLAPSVGTAVAYARADHTHGTPPGGSAVPAGTGFRHVSSGIEDTAAKRVTDADVADDAGVLESKLALAYPTHPSANDPSATEKAALAGTSGTPGAANPYVTDADPRNTDARVPTLHGPSAHDSSVATTADLTAHVEASSPHAAHERTSAKGAPNGYASLNASAKVAQDPASATSVPAASKIPVADPDGKLDGWISSDAPQATPALRSVGTGAQQACAGNDDRLSNARAPMGAASGQLGGSYPGPDVRGLRETGGPTLLTIGSIADGQMLARWGSQIVGVAAGGSTVKSIELDFGAVPVYGGSWSVLDADVRLNSNVFCWLAHGPITGRDADEAEMEPMDCVAAGIVAGSFNLLAVPREGPVGGAYRFNYLVV